MADSHIHIHIHLRIYIHIHFIVSFLSQNIAKRGSTHLIYISPTQNPVYQIILLIQNPVCHPSFPRHRTHCIGPFLHFRFRCRTLCADQIHTRNSLHSHHRRVTKYLLPLSQSAGKHFSSTTPIHNSAILLPGLQNMGLESGMKAHSSGYRDVIILRFYIFRPKYLKTLLQKYRPPESKR